MSRQRISLADRKRILEAKAAAVAEFGAGCCLGSDELDDVTFLEAFHRRSEGLAGTIAEKTRAAVAQLVHPWLVSAPYRSGPASAGFHSRGASLRLPALVDLEALERDCGEFAFASADGALEIQLFDGAEHAPWTSAEAAAAYHARLALVNRALCIGAENASSLPQ